MSQERSPKPRGEEGEMIAIDLFFKRTYWRVVECQPGYVKLCGLSDGELTREERRQAKEIKIPLRFSD